MLPVLVAVNGRLMFPCASLNCEFHQVVSE
jgi:hypothetical protein